MGAKTVNCGSPLPPPQIQLTYGTYVQNVLQASCATGGVPVAPPPPSDQPSVTTAVTVNVTPDYAAALANSVPGAWDDGVLLFFASSIYASGASVLGSR